VSLGIGELDTGWGSQISTFLSTCPQTTPFHSLGWNRVLSSEFGLRPRICLALAGDEVVALNIFYELPGPLGLNTSWSPPRAFEAVYGGPIFMPGFETAASALLKQQEKLSRAHTNYVITPPKYDSSILTTSGYSVYDQQTVVLELTRGEEDLWQMIGPKRRNMIRRAQKEGIEVRQGLTRDLQSYHELLGVTFEKRSKTPIRLSFLSKLIEELIPSGIASFHVGMRENRILAGVIALHAGSLSLYWSGASSEEGKKFAANDLLQWRCILDAKERGSTTYDLLGIDPRLPGISAFKLGFGGNVVTYCYALKRTGLGQVFRVMSALRNPERVVKRFLGKER